MPEEWIIRVEGREYGPADVGTLREWKAEGRVLPTNDARRTDEAGWEKAQAIPGLFEPPPLPPVQVTAVPKLGTTVVSSRHILPETFAIYTRGFFKYLGLTLLIIGPAICAQLVNNLAETTPGPDPNTRTMIMAALALCMLILQIVMTPVYIAGIQILTAASAAGERLGFFATLNEAVKYWPRVAFLWVFVFLCYAFWMFAPSLVVMSISMARPSILSGILVVATLTIMIWVIFRLFVNFMFWQQFAVLEGCTAVESLRRSRDLARSCRDLPWYRRPMWRGALIAALWFGVWFALNWPVISQVFSAAVSTNDPQKVSEAVSQVLKNAGANGATFTAYIIQKTLQPLLGIGFVLLFLNSKLAADE